MHISITSVSFLFATIAGLALTPAPLIAEADDDTIVPRGSGAVDQFRTPTGLAGPI